MCAAALFAFWLAQSFGTVFAAAAAYGLVYGAAPPLLDMLVLASLAGRRERWGRQRMVGSLAYGVASAVVGALVPELDDDDGGDKGAGVFHAAGLRPIAWLAGRGGAEEEVAGGDYEVLPLLTAVTLAVAGALGWLLLRRDAERIDPAGVAWRDLARLLTLRPVWLCLLNVFLIGLWEGATNIFVFPYLQDELDAPPVVLGLTKTVAAASEIVTFTVIPPLLRAVGPGWMIAAGCAGFTVKMGVYLAIRDPWHCLFAEAMHGLCFPPMFTGAVHHLSRVAGPDRRATAMAALGLAYWQTAGIAAGLVIGAWTERYGDRAGFWLCMGGSGCAAALAVALTAAGVYTRDPPDNTEGGDNDDRLVELSLPSPRAAGGKEEQRPLAAAAAAGAQGDAPYGT